MRDVDVIPRIKKRISAFETKAFRRLLQINYREHTTNLFVRAEIEKRSGHTGSSGYCFTKKTHLLWSHKST